MDALMGHNLLDLFTKDVIKPVEHLFHQKCI